MSNVDFLRQVPLFETLSDQELKKVSELMKIKTFNKRDKIFSEISNTSEIYIVKKGLVDIEKEGVIAKGNQHIATMKEGHLFGEMAFVDGYTRSASAIAREKTELFVLEKNDLVKANPDEMTREDLLIVHKIFVRIMQTISDRLRLTNETFFYTQQSMSSNPFLK
jgi:CRP-like cAMP-binding protein